MANDQDPAIPGTGTPPATGTPPVEGDGTPPAEGEGTPPEGDGTQGEAKTFTQDQVNAIAAREAQKAARGKLDPKELGFDSAKDLKTFLDAQRQKETEAQTEEQKEFETKVKEAADEARNSVLSTANARLLKAEFILAANKHDLVHAEDGFLLAQHLDEWSGVEVKEDGEVVGFDDIFFTSLKEAKPFLFKQEEGDPTNGSTSGDAGAGARGGTGKPNREAELEKLYGGRLVPWRQ